MHALWGFPLDLRGVTADQAAGLEHNLQATSYLPVASLGQLGPGERSDRAARSWSASATG